jgi:UDP-N-acetylglucosamine diphosphorylase / glucose-1-phosphate thymidylyltransferase / UDP-N-acetylgalactosamine diphosphorylase / glucosamine-1-phosphate N-acetyltransferase / galactosamine-1-phosphate N-acetyltransferase
MNIVIFEDFLYRNFDPISLSHPVFTLLCGTSKIYQKWLKTLKSRQGYLCCRPHLAQVLTEEAKLPANILPDGDTLFINGRYIPTAELLTRIKKLSIGEGVFVDGDLAAFRLVIDKNLGDNNPLTRLYESDSLNSISGMLKEVKATGQGFKYLWEIVDYNGTAITGEFAEFKKNKSSGKVDPKAALIKKSNIYLGPGVQINPQVVIDASDGPVIIERGTIVEPLTFIKGPCYIGPNCRIVGGKIREGCSFGPVCRVGGEVEEAIMLGYDNKYHEGFLGHAYLGEWVNLGAMTTNSDLKNNYSSIAVSVSGDSTDTGRMKVGCFIGDHTKTGIGTTLNTGINIGFSCNLYGGGLFIDKQIRSFSWGTPGNLVDYRLDKALETASNSMARRKIEISDAQKALFKHIFEKNR